MIARMKFVGVVSVELMDFSLQQQSRCGSVLQEWCERVVAEQTQA